MSAPGAPEPTASPPTVGLVRRAVAVVAEARPKQWSKNVLVGVAPGAAGVLQHGDVALKTLATFGIFCAAASATYYINDTVDAEADRAHPTKRFRPIAAGLVSPAVAVVAAVILFAVAITGSWLVEGWQLALTVGVYVVITLAYSLGLKQRPVIEMAAVASGFVLRAIAGGVAVHVSLSSWFLVVTSFGALFIVVGKRTGEHHTLGENRGSHRATLDLYTPQFLRSALTLSATGVVTTYCLWAFDKTGLSRRGDHLVWIELSVVPVIVGVLYVLRLLEGGGGGDPTELALEDRTLQVLGVLWALLVALGVYV